MHGVLRLDRAKIVLNKAVQELRILRKLERMALKCWRPAAPARPLEEKSYNSGDYPQDEATQPNDNNAQRRVEGFQD
jgi:hypothetical protein